MGNERYRLLAVASAQECDCWLTYKADTKARKSHYNNESKFYNRCLFCEAYGAEKTEFPGNCQACMSMTEMFGLPCQKIHFMDQIDAAIARLELAGVWED